MLNPECYNAEGLEEYNVRPLYCLKQTEVTYNYLLKMSPLPFVLSRATTVGAAKFSYHWIPDMQSEWSMLKASYTTILSFGLFGYSMIGTDICGFVKHEKVDSELCLRWHQISVFQTFSRNHHEPAWGKKNSQEPYAFEGVYKEGIIKSIRLKYRLLKWIYSLFFGKDFIKEDEKSVNKGIGMIMKPLSFVFYSDKNMPKYGSEVHETQNMFGDAVMIAPVFATGMKKQIIYFPEGYWVDLRDLRLIDSRGESREVECDIDKDIPYFLYEGNMLFYNEDNDALNAEELNNVYSVIFLLDERGLSSGGIMNIGSYKETDVYNKCIEGNCYIDFEASIKKENNRRVLRFRFNHRNDKESEINDYISTLTSLGVDF